MRIAFYAPLKPPDHPVPSGDRRVSQLFLSALGLAGHEPVLVSRFRSYDRHGDGPRQARLAEFAANIADDLLRRSREDPEHSPELWFSYHIYHKAPDWLGPTVASALNIPYVVAEASVTPIQRRGPWVVGHRATEAAIKRADAVIGLNSGDRERVLPLLRDPWRWITLKPFVDATSYRRKSKKGSHPPRLITVAMMRHGDKLVSYQLLAASLLRVLDLPWSLEVIGDGPVRREVKDALAPFDGRVTWMGSLDHDAIVERLALADVFVWPAFNEAFGVALLEAQASGLPVVAGASGGVGEIIEPGVTGLLVAPGDTAGFASAVRRMILDCDQRELFARAARRRVLQEHNLPAAARRLAVAIDTVSYARVS